MFLGLYASLAFILVLVKATVDEGPLPTAQINIDGQTVYTLPSPYASQPPEVSSPLEGILVSPLDPSGCTPFQLPVGVTNGSFVALVNRGNCSFALKSQFAIAAGAKGLVIANVLSSLYNTTNDIILNGCSTDCDAGSSYVSSFSDADLYSNAFHESTCAASKSCDSHKCALMWPESSTSSYHVCCIVDTFLPMNLNSTTTNVPVMFVNLEGSDTLWNIYQSKGPTKVEIYNRPSPFDGTAIILWFIGVLIVGIACYRSAKEERIKLSAPTSATRIQLHEEESTESVDITLWQAVGFLFLASIVLVGLYFLLKAGPQTVIIVITVFFCIGSTHGVAFLIFRPLLARFIPSTVEKEHTLPLFGTVTVAQIASHSLSFVIVLFWFLARHQPYAWFVQNIFSACLVSMFLLQIRLTSVRIAVVLLVLMFLYDIFMVFLSPYIFGTSIMVAVATAGGATSDASIAPSGEPTCARVLEERLPMLFLVPRSSWEGGYGMLGLGDLVIPGLLLSFSLRHDTITKKSTCGGYFLWLWIGYGVGLLGAFLANTFGLTINGVKGQPALLYLVPCTLIPFTILAWSKGELNSLWTGQTKERLSDDEYRAEGEHLRPATADQPFKV